MHPLLGPRLSPRDLSRTATPPFLSLFLPSLLLVRNSWPPLPRWNEVGMCKIVPRYALHHLLASFRSFYFFLLFSFVPLFIAFLILLSVFWSSYLFSFLLFFLFSRSFSISLTFPYFFLNFLIFIFVLKCFPSLIFFSISLYFCLFISHFPLIFISHFIFLLYLYLLSYF